MDIILMCPEKDVFRFPVDIWIRLADAESLHSSLMDDLTWKFEVNSGVVLTSELAQPNFAD